MVTIGFLFIILIALVALCGVILLFKSTGKLRFIGGFFAGIGVLGAVLFCLLPGFIPDAADAEARNDYIHRMEQELNLKEELAAQGVTYYGATGHVNSYYTHVELHTDHSFRLTPAMDAWFEAHPLRLLLIVDLVPNSSEQKGSPAQYHHTKYYW